MTTDAPLPPGQRVIDRLPRFGLPRYAGRCQARFPVLPLRIGGDVEQAVELDWAVLSDLARVEQISDFHCVTTWSKRAVCWSGYRFADCYHSLIQDRARPAAQAQFVILRGQDGFRARLPLADLLAADVLLADRLDGRPLGAKHGAPLRLVAPAHYGYKSVKHLCAVEFWCHGDHFKTPSLAFMDHPRARVDHEERGQWLPAPLLRWLYRPWIPRLIRLFERTLPRADENHR